MQLTASRHRHRRRILATSAAALLLVNFAQPPSAHAIALTATGVTMAFDTVPTATDWSTITGGIAGAGGIYTSTAAVDAAAQSLSAASIGATLTTLTDLANNASGVYNSTSRWLQMRPTGNAVNVLLARLNNSTTNPFSNLKVTYDYARQSNGTLEQAEGLRVFFSLTGNPNTWTPVGPLSNQGASVPGLTTTINTTGWNAGANAFLLFVDDNADPGTDDAFTIDNVNFLPTLQSLRTVVYNLAHTVGGAPNGTLALGSGNYWLNGVTPTAFQVADSITFSQEGSATINVPANVVPGTMTVSANTGTYTIGGPGRISGALVKSNTGTLELTSANSFSSAGLDGGTIITGNAASLGSGTVTVNAGGGTLQTNSDLTLSGALAGSGALVKTGAGNLTLGNATNTHTGGTTINAGTVTLSGELPGNYTVNVNSGGVLRANGTMGTGSTVSVAGGGRIAGSGTINGTTTVASGGTVEIGDGGSGTLAIQDLTFSGAANVDFNVNATASVIDVNGLIANGAPGSVLVNVSGPLVQGNIYTIFDYAGTLGGTGASAFVLGTLPNRVQAVLSNDAANTALKLAITAVDTLVWSGALSSEWSTTVLANPKNWTLSSSAGTSDFVNGDSPVFNDAAGNTTVNIGAANVIPGLVTFNNSAKDYILNGPGAITGAASLTKTGTGVLTINNTNSFTGTAQLNAGTVRVSTLPNQGVNGPLGGTSVISFNGGTLEYTGAATTTNRALSFAGNGTLRTNATLTLSGALSGAGNMIKDGTGTLIIAGNVTGLAATTVSDGILQIGNGATAGSLSGTITNNASLVFHRTDTVTITATLLGSGPIEKLGNNTLTLAGTADNNSTGTFTIKAGTVIAGKFNGTTAIGGDLIIESGTTFRYAGDNIGSQISDNSSIIINGGTFGNFATTNPAAGLVEAVFNVTLNGGSFASGRGGGLSPFGIAGLLQVNTGIALAQRGGGILAGAVEIGAGSVNLDGGSTTPTEESRLTVGGGGLTLNSGTINFNAGPSAVAANSSGSIVALFGQVTSTGTSNFVRLNPALSGVKAQVDLQSNTILFDVTGTFNIGTLAAPIDITNGALVKLGPGTLRMPGNKAYVGTTSVEDGTLSIEGTLASTRITVTNDAALSGAGTVKALTLGTFDGDTASLTIVRSGALTQLNVTDLNEFSVFGDVGSVTLNLTPLPGLGTYTLINYNGTLGGTGFGAFTLGTLPNRAVGSLIHNLVNTSIDLEIIGTDFIVWSGALSSEWSLATMANPKNWTLGSNNTIPTDFFANDRVEFTDSATTTTVNLNVVNVNPSQMTFNHSTKDYVLDGTRSITGPASLTKTGTGTLTINNSNSFTGTVTLGGGTVSIATIANSGTASPLGSGSTITFDGGTLRYTGAAGTTNRTFDLTGAGAVQVGTVATDQLILAGSISGAGTLTKIGPGTLSLTGTNTDFNGGLIIQEGTVQYTGQTVGGATQTVTLGGGTLANADTAESTFNDAADGLLRVLSTTVSGGTIAVLSASGTMVIRNPDSVSGVGKITKKGPGTLQILSPNGALIGEWAVDEGALESGTNGALGPGKVTVNGGVFAGRDSTVSNPVVLSGGALGTSGGDGTNYTGTVNVAAASGVALVDYAIPANSQDIQISGLLSGSANLTLTGSPGSKSLILHNPANTYSGIFQVTTAQGLASIPANTGKTLGTATVQLTDARLILHDNGAGNNGLLNYANPLIVAGTTSSLVEVDRVGGGNTGNTLQLGTLNIGAQTLEVVGNNGYKLAFSGATTLSGAAKFNTSSADLVLKGSVSGAFGLTKLGAGRLDLDANNTFTGPATVQAGTLSVNGNNATSVVVSGGILSGSGAITGGVDLTSAAATISPGNPVGILDIGLNLQAFAGADFIFHLAHSGSLQPPVPGTDYDQLIVGTGGAGSSTGSVNLNNADLVLTLGGGLLNNDRFFLILNDGTDLVNGTFAGLADGAIFTASGIPFRISYDANSATGAFDGGNDVAVDAIPEPGSAALLLGGLGLLAASRRRRK